MTAASHGASGSRVCDVLVVGGGPAGLYLATSLAQQDVDVVVLERRPEPTTHSRAIGLHPPALAALHTLGLEEPALAEGVMIREGLARSRGRQLGSLTFASAWPQRPHVLALPQHRTEALLVDRLAALSPDALRRGEEVVTVDAKEEGVRVTTRRTVSVGTGPALGMTWEASLLVGADGPESLVRERAGIPTRGRTYPDTYLMGDFADTTSDGSAAVLYVEPEGIVESFPLPGGVRRWVAHTGTMLAEPSPQHLAELVARRTGGQLDVASSSMISAFAVRRRIADRMVSGRQVILGDAAHEVSPIGGQGMTLGWLDASVLAPLLVRVLAERSGGPLHLLPGFRDVERSRLGAARRAARRAELNMAAGRPLPTRAAAARDGAVRAALGTPLRGRLAGAFTMRSL